MFVVTKFRQDLLHAVRQFVVLFHHKPLSYIYEPNRSILHMASQHIQRWLLVLSGYDYSFLHGPDKEHANANLFSCLPLSTTPTITRLSGGTVLLFECLHMSPLTISENCRGADLDPTLAKVQTFVLSDWTSHLTEGEFQLLWMSKNELLVSDLVLIWGNRVIVPPRFMNEQLRCSIAHNTS